MNNITKGNILITMDKKILLLQNIIFIIIICHMNVMGKYGKISCFRNK